MICKNCGNYNPDNAIFCKECGSKVSDGTQSQPSQGQQSASMTTQSQSSNQQTQSSNSQQLQDIQNNQSSQNSNTSQYNGKNEEPSKDSNANSVDKPVVTKKKKKAGKILLIFGIIFTIIAILALVVLFTWRAAFFKISPDKYTALLAANTISDITDETNDIKENIFGFDFSIENEFTTSVDLDITNNDNNTTAKAVVANFPDKKELLFEGNYENDAYKVGAQGFVDDEYAGVKLEGTNNKYLVVPSKTFGEELSDSDGYLAKELDKDYDDAPSSVAAIIDLIKHTDDISYSSIKNNLLCNSETSKEAKTIVSENLLDFLDKCEFGDREKIKYEFSNGKATAYSISVECKTKDFYDLIINTLQDMKNSKVLKDAYGKEFLNSFDDTIKELKEEKKNITVKEIVFELIEYKGRIVSFTFEVEENENENYDKYYEKNTFSISCTDKKHLLNGIKMVTENEFEYKDEDFSNKGDSTDVTELIANWVDEDKKINIEILGNTEYSSDSYEHTSDSKFSFDIDYSKEKWTLEYKSEYEYDWHDEDSYSHTDKEKFEGKCKKDSQGVTFNFDHEFDNSYSETLYNVEYDTWLENKYAERRSDYYYDLYLDYKGTRNISYLDWFSEYSSYYDEADWQFEEWLADYYDKDTWDLYVSEESYESDVVDILGVKFNLGFKNNATLKIDDAKKENILDWEVDDFEDMIYDFTQEIRK